MTRGLGDGPAGQAAASGGTRGAGTAALGKVLAVCGATAAGGAACVAGGVLDPTAIGSAAEAPKPAIEQPSRSVDAPVDETEVNPPVEPVDPGQAAAEAPTPEPTPAQQANQQFGFEAAPPAPVPSGGGEFGGPSGGGGGGGSSGGGGFGFER